MDANVTWQEGLSFTGSADSGFQIKLGADVGVGGANDGFRPLELMAISLAGCTAMDVISILQKKKQAVTDFIVLVHADKGLDHPRIFTQITIFYVATGHHIEESALLRAIELSATKYCPAQAMLGKVVPMELKYKIEEKGEGLVCEGSVTLPVSNS
jgi:putative redox protein